MRAKIRVIAVQMLKYGEVWFILKVKQRTFPDGLDVGCEKKRGNQQ